jgi:hypothetical protein
MEKRMIILKRHKGLGDTIAAITEATGIKAVVEAVTEDCGCQERQASLNDPNLLINKILYGTKQDIEVLRGQSEGSGEEEREPKRD